MEKKIYNQNELIENASNILKTVFNGYYETRLLRVDLKTKDWTHAINTARRMPLTTLYEEEKRKELIQIFMLLRGNVPSQEGPQSGFVHPVGETETEVDEVTTASTEELDTTAAPAEETSVETTEAPVEEALSNVAPTETAETATPEEVTEVRAEVPAEPEKIDMSAPAETEDETESPVTEEPATEESVAEETVSEESIAEEPATEEPTSEDTTEADPVETIVEASEEKADETAAETKVAPKFHRRKK